MDRPPPACSPLGLSLKPGMYPDPEWNRRLGAPLTLNQLSHTAQAIFLILFVICNSLVHVLHSFFSIVFFF